MVRNTSNTYKKISRMLQWLTTNFIIRIKILSYVFGLEYKLQAHELLPLRKGTDRVCRNKEYEPLWKTKYLQRCFMSSDLFISNSFFLLSFSCINEYNYPSAPGVPQSRFWEFALRKKNLLIKPLTLSPLSASALCFELMHWIPRAILRVIESTNLRFRWVS